MEEPSWFAPIVVISADGVHLDERSGASLIAKSAAVAKLSHQVIERAANSVVCCLASRKLQHRTGLEASGGAIIKPPSAAKVRRFLVSEGEVKSPIIPALEKAGWEIITNLFKWPTMKEHVQQWKEQKKWQGIADYLNSLGLATVEQSEDLKDPK